MSEKRRSPRTPAAAPSPSPSSGTPPRPNSRARRPDSGAQPDAEPADGPAASPARVTLSTASVYPMGVAAAFETAARLGYDGVEVMVLSDPVTQSATILGRLAERHGVPVTSIHAPTLLVAQRVYGASDPWTKIDRSIDLAHELGCPTIVLHPPFRWQREYARTFVDGVAEREHERGITLAVENMFPWRARQRHVQAYLPAWDPVSQPYDHVTIDLSHASTAHSDVLAMQEALGSRLAHVHLADGSGSLKDEHLVPGRGNQPCAEFLAGLVRDGYAGDVTIEVNTRRRGGRHRQADLRASLAFARAHLGQSRDSEGARVGDELPTATGGSDDISKPMAAARRLSRGGREQP